MTRSSSAFVPTIGVVLPTRNRRGLLAQALRSALGQQGVNVKIIVVDDGSSDATREAPLTLADPRVEWLRNEHSVGVSGARNQAIERLRTPYVAFLDDDDIWAPDKLSRQWQSLTSTQLGWCCVGAVMVDAELRVLHLEIPPPAPSVVRQISRRNVITGGSNVMVRRDVLNMAGRFDPALTHLEDWDMWQRLGRTGPPAVIPEPLFAYRLHAGNADPDTWNLAQELSLVEQRHAGTPTLVAIDRAMYFRWAGSTYLRCGARIKAARAYLHAARHGDPISLLRAITGMIWPGFVRLGSLPTQAHAEHRHRARVWLASYSK